MGAAGARTPPPPGSYSALEEGLRAAAARDLRSPARSRVDVAWQRVGEHVKKLHGRELPVEVFDCLDAGEEAALQAARLAGEQYVELAAGAFVTKVTMDATFAIFVEKLSDFVGRATSTWPSAADRQAAERRRLEDGWR